MADLVSGNAAIGQSGGPTAVINQSLAGVIEGLKAGLANTGHVKRVLGMRHGVRGIVKPGGEGLVDLTSIPADRLERLARTPSAALGSTRDKPDEAYCQKILDGARAHDIRYFFYIGGNDSADTCRIVSEKAADAGYDLRCFHVPKTIDNDLLENDHTPGFPSAARYVTLALMGDALDNASLGGIKINVIMGRNAGFLTAAASLARGSASNGADPADRPAPHLIYLPEVPFSTEAFLADVEAVYAKLGRCQIAVSEGIRDEHRRGDRAEADAWRWRGRCPRQRAAFRLGRARRRACRSRQDGAYACGRQGAAGARRHLRLHPALLAASLLGRRGGSPRRRPLCRRACGTRRQKRLGDHHPHQQRA